MSPMAALPGMLRCVLQLAVWAHALLCCIWRLDIQYMQIKALCCPAAFSTLSCSRCRPSPDLARPSSLQHHQRHF